jgi:hypothetical protein
MFSHKTEVYFQTLQVATYVMLISKVCAELQQTLRKKIIAKKTITTKPAIITSIKDNTNSQFFATSFVTSEIPDFVLIYSEKQFNNIVRKTKRMKSK